MSFRTGVLGTAKFNTTELPIIGWGADPVASILAYVNSKTGGHVVRLPGITDGGVLEFQIDWDDSNNLFSTMSLRVGSQLTAIKQYIDGPSGTNFRQIASAYIQRTPLRVEVAGKIAYSIVALCDGTWGEIGQSAS